MPEPSLRQFSIAVPQAALDDLARRLRLTRWPDQVEGAGWDYGAELSYVRELAAYWLDGFDWRAQERRLNELPQFVAAVDGLDIHFVHLKGTGPAPFPLLISHGWPSSFAEMEKIARPLADPGRHGGAPDDAFDVVIPSLPGFGFSGKPLRRGRTWTAAIFKKLMTEVLGYPVFGAQGGDVGARVTSALGRFHAGAVAGIHISSVDLEWPDPLPGESSLSPAESDYLRRVRMWEKAEGAYAEIQGTRPQTIAYALNDSPAGLLAWIVEKFRAWSDCGGDVESRFTKDEILTNVSIYWFTETINSSMRRYYDKRNDPRPNFLKPGQRIAAPAGIAMFPGERDLLVPREFAERCYDVIRWTEMPRGGHFPALEEPELLIEDIRAFFRSIRPVAPRATT